MTEAEKVRKYNPYSQTAILNVTIKDLEKENAELKAQINVLLSCSNCTENKGGYICEKEYNDKCLLQKIEYIKELKEQIEKMKICGNCKHKNNYNFPTLEEPCNKCLRYSKWEMIYD